MGSIICIFKRCRWIWFGNVEDFNGSKKGLYQCNRCKTLSSGLPGQKVKTGVED